MTENKLPHLKETIQISATPNVVWRFLTEPQLLSKWWWISPHQGRVVEMNVSACGHTTISSIINGREVHSTYVYILVVKCQKLIATTALTKQLYPSSSSLAETIIFNLRPFQNGTELTVDAHFKDMNVVSWLWNRGYYTKWINNLTTLKQLAISLQDQVSKSNSTPPAQP
ncbi:MAG: hypothetical protein B7Y05_08765 [Polynucleobacter sp. 24-46-87]|jgi:uncharacterized protein YndB with AHSA1/START domain|uniref:SRPBCC domain-containing protein n=1 Tax=unclassified Polynucleobacter TaxID=2640945 RepID=UPI000BDA4DCF|nr:MULTISPECIES: SRPBCC domain-containing protein [unclassified Polynucleobacter]OYY58897.1 MAG: hypothetical protein B7Y55_01540 [Polynucleobacter sp. 35-46-207]OYZ37897.1 MAG: hypothetical protein B7Y22_02735 [Polynucleobacter sp. 16-46-70]OZA13855.1 MAG: hypothetical protein B7Y05_08765 [Polynucleobacter sp. 24-46-87]OZA41162.1 MAG: hypothetical protein B7X83_02970 [Polynucleobacter sp. 17-46-58]OZB48815.1 MAG: hypothetical protein B7X60_03040 [Polynucleobacter sp. 39-45-136]